MEAPEATDWLQWWQHNLLELEAVAVGLGQAELTALHLRGKIRLDTPDSSQILTTLDMLWTVLNAENCDTGIFLNSLSFMVASVAIRRREASSTSENISLSTRLLLLARQLTVVVHNE